MNWNVHIQNLPLNIENRVGVLTGLSQPNFGLS
jgi:hypothetical protein